MMKDSLYRLIDLIRARSPETINLLTAQSDAEFEGAIDKMLEKGVSHLETNSRNFAELSENGLTAVLAGFLKGTPCLTVMQEAHSNGHVDLTIEVGVCSPSRRILGEAKIYDGPSYHLEGLEQLLSRYATGREGRGLLIVYVRAPDITGKIKGIRARMDEELPMEQRGPTEDHPVRWWFLSTHGHSSGTDCRVGHIGCNLHTGD